MENQYLFAINILCKYCNIMKNKETFESSIKILTDLTISDTEYHESNSINNNNKVSTKQKDDTHHFFDWESWAFIVKKIV